MAAPCRDHREQQRPLSCLDSGALVSRSTSPASTQVARTKGIYLANVRSQLGICNMRLSPIRDKISRRFPATPPSSTPSTAQSNATTRGASNNAASPSLGRAQAFLCACASWNGCIGITTAAHYPMTMRAGAIWSSRRTLSRVCAAKWSSTSLLGPAIERHGYQRQGQSSLPSTSRPTRANSRQTRSDGGWGWRRSSERGCGLPPSAQWAQIGSNGRPSGRKNARNRAHSACQAIVRKATRATVKGQALAGSGHQQGRLVPARQKCVASR